MPELPEVETIRRDIEKFLVSKKIKKISVFDPRVIRNKSCREFIDHLNGKKIRKVDRQGKAIILQFGTIRDTSQNRMCPDSSNQGYLVIQPMMTGQLIQSRHLDQPVPRVTKVVFHLSDDSYLIYNDQRLFGRLTWVNNLAEISYLKSLGPDPLSKEFNPYWLDQSLKRHKMPIKSLLMHQNFISGIGNIYASEILFKARILPRRPAFSLTRREVKKLHRAAIDILDQAIRYRGTSMINYRDGYGRKGRFINRIKVYGREDEACSKCQSPIRKIVLSGRSTFYCEKCQG